MLTYTGNTTPWREKDPYDKQARPSSFQLFSGMIAEYQSFPSFPLLSLTDTKIKHRRERKEKEKQHASVKLKWAAPLSLHN